MPDISYKTATICFWSGTGNSYRVSTWIGKIAENRGLKPKILSLDTAKSTNILNGEKDCFITIVFPTHGFTAPWQVLKSVWKLPPGNLTHAYYIATRAGLKIGSVFIPGISGSADYIVSLILLLKGYKVRGTLSVDMPSNWYALHPIQNRKCHEAIIDRAEHKVTGFMIKILSKSKVWFTGNNLYEITFGILLSFISIRYLFFGKFFLAKLFFANNKCDGCGLCEKHCTVKAITMWGKDKPRPYWKYNCESCMKCAALCPRNAIEAWHCWGVILYFITAFPLSVFLCSWFGAYSAIIDKLDVHLFGNVLNILYFYPAIFISYYIFSLLITIPLFNYLFTHTTMTHVPSWRRYREPGTKLKDIA